MQDKYFKVIIFDGDSCKLECSKLTDLETIRACHFLTTEQVNHCNTLLIGDYMHTAKWKIIIRII